MPPNLDIYVISRSRSRDMIERFLNTYVDIEASADRGREELMLLPLGSSESPPRLEDWDWEPSGTLSNIIERGLQHPPRAFSVSLRTRNTSLAGSTLGFTADDQVFFGLSLDDEGADPENLAKAKELLYEMVESLQGRSAFIGVETPPPLVGVTPSSDFIVYSWPTT